MIQTNLPACLVDLRPDSPRRAHRERFAVGATVAGVALLASTPAQAAHPLQTEDTGTQGTGNIEIENGLQRARSGPVSVFVYQPQVSVGLAPTVDAIFQPSWIAVHGAAPGASDVSGLGDTNVDVKWRFLGIDPVSLAVRAGLELPTAHAGLGLPHGDLSTHALAVVTFDATPTTWHANLGYTRDPRAAATRAGLAAVSAAVLHAASERLYFTADIQFGQSTDATRHGWPGSALAGVIYTLIPGLDADLGWQTSLHDAPATREWLAGLTYRFGT